VHYSNSAPPQGTRATKLDIEVKSAPEAPAPESKECHTLRCQGERLEQRIAQREAADAQAAALRAQAEPPPWRGLDFRKYISLQRGMSEGELLGIAGPPDLRTQDHWHLSYVYMPTPADPFTTTILIDRGRITDIERKRKF
jgi:hypothetical protein